MSAIIMSTPTKPAAPVTKSKPSSALKKKSTSLPAETVDYLKAWMMSPEHIAHPYPTEQEKAQIMADTGIELKQLTNWFVNNRKRFWKPRVEARLQQPTAAASVIVNQQVVVNQPLQRKSSSQSVLAPAPLAVDRPLATTQEQPVSAIAASPASLVRRVSTASLSQHLLDNACVSDASSQYSSDAESGESGSVSEGGDDDMSPYENSISASNDEVSNEDSVVARTESVSVHILRPLKATRMPTIADVSILATVPAERILCTYERCPLKYSFPLDSIQDRKKVQNRRDAEIVRLKRKFLKLYLEECGMVSSNTSTKRSLEEEIDSIEVENTPRKKFCLESPSLWKKACQTAEGVYDIDLPTLEEATLLFGFSRGLGA